MTPLVTIVIVTYRSKAELATCIESCLGSDLPVKLVVIDNDSSDGTLEMARTYVTGRSNVVVFSSGRNIGLAAANNLVLPHLEGEYLLILNPDTQLRPDTISVLISELKTRPDVGIVGPLNLYENGERHTSFHHSWRLSHLVLWRFVPYSLVRNLSDRLSRYRDSEVLFVSGSCLLIRAHVFKTIDGYDPHFFLTVEDACDLCRRAAQIGYKTRFVPQATMTHLCGRSNAQVPYLSTLEGYRGDIYYFFKHHGQIIGSLAYAIILLACGFKTLVSLVKFSIFRRKADAVNMKVYWSILAALLTKGFVPSPPQF